MSIQTWLTLTEDKRWIVMPDLRPASDLEVQLWERYRGLEAQVAEIRGLLGPPGS